MKKIFIWAAVFLLLCGGLWMARRPYRNWKQRRAVAEAKASLGKSDYRNAALSARRALEANPNNVEACRIMAQITEQFRFPEAIFWRHRLVDLESNVAQNRLDLARTALLLGNSREADGALRGVKEADRNRADFHELAALLAVAEHNLPAAEAQASTASKLEPDNKTLQMNLAVLDVQSPDKKLEAAAQKNLEQLSSDPAFRRDALRQLAVSAARDGDFVRSEHYMRLLLAKQPAVFDDQMLHLTLLSKGNNPDLASALAALQQQVPTNAAQVSALAEWMLSHRMIEGEFQWLSSLPPKTRDAGPVIVALADVYAQRHNWAAIQSLLANRQWGDTDFLRLALLARAARERQDEITSQSKWHEATLAASGRRQPMAALLRMTEAWGWNREKEEAAWSLVQRFPAERWALQILERLYNASGNTRGLQRVYQALLKIEPSDVAARNDFAAISLLLGSHLEEAHRLARENYETRPNDVVVMSTYAYSLDLQGQPQAGLKLFDKFAASLHQPGVATYYGLLLADAGQKATAVPYLEIARKSNLLPEEKALVAQALRP